MKWIDNRHDQVAQLLAILAAESRRADKNPGQRTVPTHLAIPVLVRSIDNGGAVPSSILYRSVANALSKELGETSPNIHRLLNRAKAEAAITPAGRFRYCGRISMAGPATPLRRAVAGVWITISAEPPKWVAKHLSSKPSARARTEDKRFERYAYVACTVPATTDIDAFNAARDAIDILRGLWSFSLYNRRISRSFRTFTPQAQLGYGPLSLTLGDTATSKVVDWHSEETPIAGSARHHLEHIERHKPHWDNLRRRLKQGRHATHWETALRRYARCLDEKIPARAVVEMWSFLEFLFGNPRDHSEIVNRCSYFFKDRDMARLELDCMRRFRNEVVHDFGPAARPHRFEQEMVARLKVYIDQSIDLMMGFLRRYQRKEEGYAVLSLSRDPELLQKELDRRLKDPRRFQLALAETRR